MVKISIAKLEPKASSLTGACIGESHAEQMREAIKASSPSSELVVLDFRKIESASASYLKRIINPFFEDVTTHLGQVHGRAPVVINVESKDLMEDLEDYLAGKERVLIMASEAKGGIHLVRVLGHLDAAADETFRTLCELRETTALKLYERHGTRTTNQTAWNNRLVQLVQLRIASRRREGRFWIYQPTVNT